MYGEYSDGSTVYVDGYNETDCTQKLCDLQAIHGDIKFYSGVDDEDFVCGERVSINEKSN